MFKRRVVVPIDLVLAGIAAGNGLKTVSRMLNLDHSTVRSRLKKLGKLPPLKLGRRRVVIVPMPQVLDEIAAGQGLKTVARKLGLCHSTLRVRLIEAEHPPPTRKGRPRSVVVPVHQIRLRQKRGESLWKICKSLGLKWSTVDDRIKSERRATIKNREKGLVL